MSNYFFYNRLVKKTNLHFNFYIQQIFTNAIADNLLLDPVQPLSSTYLLGGF